MEPRTAFFDTIRSSVVVVAPEVEGTPERMPKFNESYRECGDGRDLVADCEPGHGLADRLDRSRGRACQAVSAAPDIYQSLWGRSMTRAWRQELMSDLQGWLCDLLSSQT
jgi:hypothetical protein